MSAKNGASSATASPPQKQSRLQRRAPPSLQIACPTSSHWNAAIPLLSPLAASPTSPELIDRPQVAGVGSREAPRTEQEKKPIVIKSWQHPAAPFCYDPPPLNPSFVPV